MKLASEDRQPQGGEKPLQRRRKAKSRYFFFFTKRNPFCPASPVLPVSFQLLTLETIEISCGFRSCQPSGGAPLSCTFQPWKWSNGSAPPDSALLSRHRISLFLSLSLCLCLVLLFLLSSRVPSFSTPFLLSNRAKSRSNRPVTLFLNAKSSFVVYLCSIIRGTESRVLEGKIGIVRRVLEIAVNFEKGSKDEGFSVKLCKLW